MHLSRIAHTLREQFHDFTQTLASRLSKPMTRFLQEMVYGISASGDVKLSNIGRALQEQIPLQKTEDRLSRNLRQATDSAAHSGQGRNAAQVANRPPV